MWTLGYVFWTAWHPSSRNLRHIATHLNPSRRACMNLLRMIVATTTLGVVQSVGAAAPQSVPGYAYGASSLQRAPYTPADLAALQKTLLFTAEDVAALRQS